MARKTATPAIRITSERAGRLHRLLKSLADGPLSRISMLKKLKVGMRTFYRDLDLLRECGIVVNVESKGYVLEGSMNDALTCLPFPDPELTFGDAVSLAKGRTAAHAKLRQMIDDMTR